MGKCHCLESPDFTFQTRAPHPECFLPALCRVPKPQHALISKENSHRFINFPHPPAAENLLTERVKLSPTATKAMVAAAKLFHWVPTACGSLGVLLLPWSTGQRSGPSSEGGSPDTANAARPNWRWEGQGDQAAVLQKWEDS
jgi:hypothetical protein